MWMVSARAMCRRCHESGSGMDGIADAAPHAGPHHAADVGGCAHAAPEGRAPEHQGGAQHRRHGPGPAGGHRPAGVGRPGRLQHHPGGLPAGQLAGPVWHRPGPGPSDRPDAGADQQHCPGIQRVCRRPLAQGRRALPPAVPTAADGPVGRLPDGRPVQPVRVLRDHAGRLVRPAAAWFGAPARAGRPALHRHQSGGVLAVPDRRVHAVWHHRHAEHGRSGPGHPECLQCRPRTAAHRRRHPGHSLPDQGRAVAIELLAGAGLQRRHRPGRRTVRTDDQGGHLHHPAPVDADVLQRGR